MLVRLSEFSAVVVRRFEYEAHTTLYLIVLDGPFEIRS
jgi:hypothetical protein